MRYVLAVDDGSGRMATKEIEATADGLAKHGQQCLVLARVIGVELSRYPSLARYTMSVIYEEGSDEEI